MSDPDGGMSGWHQRLDFDYGAGADEAFEEALKQGLDTEERQGPFEETLLHVATRRYRTSAIALLLAHGADMNACTKGGKTAWAHAARRGFDDLARLLEEAGASKELSRADELALAVVNGRLEEAARLIAADASCVRTGNPEEDRLLADVAGRNDSAPVELLIEAGADLCAPALDDGTPLHQAAWFGQPRNAQLLIAVGAPLEVFDRTHASSPLGWVVHGSKYSGGAKEREANYVELAEMLLTAGAKTHYPGDESGSDYFDRLMRDASPKVAEVLRRHREA